VNAASGLTGVLQSRNQHGGQNGDDCNDDKKFY
jgi:hypothetical protein